jgi:hypothetical protein
MHRVEGFSGREISRRTGLHRDTVARLLAATAVRARHRSRLKSALSIAVVVESKPRAMVRLVSQPNALTPSEALLTLNGIAGYPGLRRVISRRPASMTSPTA